MADIKGHPTSLAMHLSDHEGGAGNVGDNRKAEFAVLGVRIRAALGAEETEGAFRV
jgi:hypothetical protein